MRAARVVELPAGRRLEIRAVCYGDADSRVLVQAFGASGTPTGALAVPTSAVDALIRALRAAAGDARHEERRGP